MTEEQIEKIVANVVANLAFEGMECTEEDKAAIRRIASGQTTAEQEVAAVIAKYRLLTEDAADLAIYEDAHAEYVSSGMKSYPISELWKELNLDGDRKGIRFVEAVTAQDDYTLLLTFTGGEKRLYNARPLLEKSIYYPLKNIDFFLSAKVECGTVVWNDDVDIAPEHLYERSHPVGGAENA